MSVLLTLLQFGAHNPSMETNFLIFALLIITSMMVIVNTFPIKLCFITGLIHPCSHPNDEDAHFRISEQEIFQNIFNYIDVSLLVYH